MKNRKLTNLVSLSGYAGGRMVSGNTKDGGEAFSFRLESDDSGSGGMRVRVNCYGNVASDCKDNLDSGSFCHVVGELMNRPGKSGELTEVRAKRVVIVPSRKQLEREELEEEDQY